MLKESKQTIKELTDGIVTGILPAVESLVKCRRMEERRKKARRKESKKK